MVCASVLKARPSTQITGKNGIAKQPELQRFRDRGRSEFWIQQRAREAANNNNIIRKHGAPKKTPVETKN
jgi:hypothetical protein